MNSKPKKGGKIGRITTLEQEKKGVDCMFSNVSDFIANMFGGVLMIGKNEFSCFLLCI